MLAWTTTPVSPGGLTLREVAEPSPLPQELLVRVEAFAPNPGDLAALLLGTPAGSIPGWDGAGIVLEAAADGAGPQVGDRVVLLGLGARGWAQRRAVPHAAAAAAPSDAAWERLATLPVPATSARRHRHDRRTAPMPSSSPPPPSSRSATQPARTSTSPMAPASSASRSPPASWRPDSASAGCSSSAASSRSQSAAPRQA